VYCLLNSLCFGWIVCIPIAFLFSDELNDSNNNFIFCFSVQDILKTEDSYVRLEKWNYYIRYVLSTIFSISPNAFLCYRYAIFAIMWFLCYIEAFKIITLLDIYIISRCNQRHTILTYGQNHLLNLQQIL